MIIRRARNEDLPEIVRIVNVAIAVGYAHFATEAWETEAAGAELAAAGPTHPWFVAEVDGTVVGMCKAGPWKARGAYRWTVEVGIYVNSSQQGQGIGRALYQALLPALEVAGVRAVVAGIALPSWPSVALHEALGFKEAGVLPRIGYKAGAWRDVGYWVLHLGGDGPP